MSDPATDTVSVTLNVAPAFEERVIDWLLGQEAIAGFTGHVAYGHGSRASDLTVAEQVSGRQRRVEFRVELAAAALDEFVRLLGARFAGTDLYYLVTPVLRFGHLRNTPHG
jgi:hypothetical protein